MLFFSVHWLHHWKIKVVRVAWFPLENLNELSSKTISCHLYREYSPGKLSGFLPSYVLSLCTDAPSPHRRLSPDFFWRRGASVLRLVYSLPLACVAGVEKGRGREEGKKAGGLGTFPLLSSSMAEGWGGGLVCEQALYGQTELLRELARRLREGGALGPS